MRTGTPRAFTLLELLTVIAIVGVLAAITFAATGGASERARHARCRSELAVLAQALDAYRARFGEYPQTGAAANNLAGSAAADDGPGILFNALNGRRGPGASLVSVEGRSFVSLAVFTLQTDAVPAAAGPAQSANAFVDPWGRRYLYFYRTGAAWIARAPLLVSAGTDGAVEVPSDLGSWDGTLPLAAANADNLSSSSP